MKLLFSRFGGKKHKAKEIISYFPEHLIYVEPFLGSGAVFLAKDSVDISVLNDLDPLVYNIFRLAKEKGKEFDDLNKAGKFDWTPLRDTWVSYRQSLTDKTLDPLEILFRSIYVIHNSWSGIGTSFTANRRGNPLYVVELADYKDLLKNTHIYQEDYVKIIKYYDNPDTFFYLDPPYDIALEKKYYEYDNNMTLETLATTLKGLKGKFCLSLDITPKTTELFRDFICHKIDFNYRCQAKSGWKVKEEYLITNY